MTMNLTVVHSQYTDKIVNEVAAIVTNKTPFGTLIIWKTSLVLDKINEVSQENLHTKDESTQRSVLKFSPRCVKMQYLSTFGSISRGFRTDSILQEDHPVFDMCENGDISGLQACFGDVLCLQDASPAWYSVELTDYFCCEPLASVPWY